VNVGLSMRFLAEEFALRSPVERQTGIIHQPVGGELRRVPSVQDRPYGVGGEEGQPQEAGHVGTADPLFCGNLFQR
jgi:hypothetical protein